MRLPNERLVTKFLLSAVIGFSAAIWISLHRLESGIHTVIDQGVQTMQTISQEVTQTSSGDVATITTTRNTGESVADWLARHAEAVTAFRDG